MSPPRRLWADKRVDLSNENCSVHRGTGRPASEAGQGEEGGDEEMKGEAGRRKEVTHQHRSQRYIDDILVIRICRDLIISQSIRDEKSRCAESTSPRPGGAGAG